MGNPSRPDLHPRIVEWAKKFRGRTSDGISIVTPSSLNEKFGEDLKEYFRLCALSRSTSALPELVGSAYGNVFKVRVALEKSIIKVIEQSNVLLDKKVAGILQIVFLDLARNKGQVFACLFPAALLQYYALGHVTHTMSSMQLHLR